MPVVHKYKNKNGFYIKSSTNGKIITYQVTTHGCDYLTSNGYGDNYEISINNLMRLKNSGYIYTKGSGPGDIDTLPRNNAQNNQFNSNLNKKQPNFSEENNDFAGCGIGCLAIFIIFIILSTCTRM